MNKEYRISSDVLKTFFHDVNGPIVTTLGIGTELRESVQSLAVEIAGLESEIEPARLNNLHRMIEEDIMPCVRHIETSINRLQGSVSAFAVQFPEA